MIARSAASSEPRHDWSTSETARIDPITRTSYSRARSRDPFAPVAEELIDTAIGERVHEHVAQDQWGNRCGVGSCAGACDEVHRRAQGSGEQLALETEVRKDLARLRDDRHAILANVLESADERTHISSTGLGGEKCLCRGED